VSRAARMLAAVLWAGGGAAAGAVEWVARDDELILHPGEAWTRELAAWAPSAEIHGTVREDFFLAAQTARLDGRFEGDVWAWAAERIDWEGQGADDVRFAAPAMAVRGRVDGTAVLAGGTVSIEPGAILGRRTTIHAQDVIFQGSAAGPVTIRAARITLGGHIDGAVQLDAQDIVIQPGTHITGLLRYTAPSPLVLGPGARADGGVLRHTPPPAAGGRFGALYIALALLVVPAAGLMLAAPRLAAGAADELRTRPGRCLWTGAGWAILAPLAMSLLAVSGLGVPAALALGAALVAALLPGAAPSALALGHRLGIARGLRGRRALLNQAAPGLALFAGIALVPGLGPALAATLLVFGGGALLRTAAGAEGRTGEPAAAPADENA
jgi:cytoskeletal protein CcmA (bactofilin family)